MAALHRGRRANDPLPTQSADRPPLGLVVPLRKRCYADSRVIPDPQRVLGPAPNVFEMCMMDVMEDYMSEYQQGRKD